MSWGCLVLAILATAFGQYWYKRYKLSQVKGYFFGAVLLFVMTPVMSYCALKRIPVDTVYMFTALTILVVLLLSRFGLKESISSRKLTGAGMILAGVIIYGIK